MNPQALPVRSGAQTITHTTWPSRVVFGRGTIAAVAEEVARLGRSRVLLLGGRHVAEAIAAIRDSLGRVAVAGFDGAVMHTPADVTDEALRIAEDNAVDCVVSVGGGSATGLSKALAVRNGYDQVIVPTTYAGSELTPVLGETVDGAKTTRSSPEILPEVVVYDVDLTLGLPAAISLTSAVNALAHAVEALYAPDADPVTDALALHAITGITAALPSVIADGADVDARSVLLQSAWLAGACLGHASMGLHHKLCHVLGGAFGLPHAQTHTVLLPHTMAYNAPAAPEAVERIAAAMGVADAPTAVFALVLTLGGPTSLAGLGFSRTDIGAVADMAVDGAGRYRNPREVTAAGIAALLDDAWAGRRPSPRTTEETHDTRSTP